MSSTMNGPHSEFIAAVLDLDCTLDKVRELLSSETKICRTVLYHALMNRNCNNEVIRELLTHGVDSTCCFKRMTEKKLNAALLNPYCKQDVIFEVLDVESRTPFADRLFFRRENPFYYALKAPICSDSLIRLFVSYGYSVDEIVEHELSALGVAVGQSNIKNDVIRELAVCGRVDATNLYRAMHNPNLSSELLHELICHKTLYEYDESVLQEALLASRGYDTISLLVNLGAPVNSKNRDGDTPLHCLTKSARIDLRILNLFLDMHVDINPSDNLGNTPLHYAVKTWKYNFPIIRKLLLKGADFCSKNAEDMTPLEIVLKKSTLSSSDIKCAELLIKHAVKKEIMSQQRMYIAITLAAYLDPCSYAFVHLSKYLYKCNSELRRLDVMLTEDLSLYIFINRGIIVKETSILDTLVDIMYKNKCSVYNDIIAEYIDRDFLVDAMKNLIVFMNTNEKSIHLDQRCNTVIAKSSSKIDLLNLIMVFHKPPQISILDISSKKKKTPQKCSYAKGTHS